MTLLLQILILVAVFLIKVSSVIDSNFSLKQNENQQLQIIFQPFYENIRINFNTTGLVEVYGSFCKNSTGTLIFEANGLVKRQLSTEVIYEFREKTRCSTDSDPFYEKPDISKRLIMNLFYIWASARFKNFSVLKISSQFLKGLFKSGNGCARRWKEVRWEEQIGLLY